LRWYCIFDQLAQHLVAVDLLADLEQLHFFVVDLRRADPVDAGDRGDDDHVAAGEERRRRAWRRRSISSLIEESFSM
jgi:hypothetical protein